MKIATCPRCFKMFYDDIKCYAISRRQPVKICSGCGMEEEAFDFFVSAVKDKLTEGELKKLQGMVEQEKEWLFAYNAMSKGGLHEKVKDVSTDG